MRETNIAKCFLIISPESWGNNFVSKHHYAAELAKRGSKVFFLNPPNKGFSVSATEIDNVYQVNHPAMLKGLRFLPVFVQKQLVRLRFRKLFELINTQPDVIWSFDPSILYHFDVLPSEIVRVLHIVDLTQCFNLKWAVPSSHIQIANSKPIEIALSEFSNEVFRITHGVSKKNLEKQHPKVKLPGDNQLKAVYIGNLAIKYLDWELVQQLAEMHEDVDFIFIGPRQKSNLSAKGLNSKIEGDLTSNKNFYFLPPIPSGSIPSYLEQADILLLCYKFTQYPDQLANPHKLMEYLASGRPIMATYTSEYEDKELFPMAKSIYGFLEGFSRLKCKLSTFDSQKAKDFAHSNSYENQLKRINDIYSKKFPNREKNLF